MKLEYIIGGILVVALGAGVAVIFTRPASGVGAGTESGSLSAEEKPLRYSLSPEITSPSGFVNTDGKPVTIGEFRGKKVVLIDFWTYSCINCQRTLPYLRQWYEKYADQGLEIIGVHTPEFAFEKVLGNVQAATNGFKLTYPIVLDNDYATWRAFGNNYWPRKYLIDIDGYIVYDHIGEGAYAETEEAIQKALAERAERLGVTAPPDAIGSPADATPMDERKVGSPETYFGAARNDNFGSGPRGKTGTQFYEEPQTVISNTLYLVGKWDIADEYAQTSSDVGSETVGSDRVDYRYSAKNVYFVAGSASGKPIEMEVLRDSAPLSPQTAGADVYFKDGRSYVRINENRLYHVIGDSEYGEHFLEFIISQPGLQAYTFTFG
ncbi:redoxin family protein [Candidatus Kaiserbacteria bacterium]|nr:redoxin family protein [Candidatus Kaiserbacteria bacterium]